MLNKDIFTIIVSYSENRCFDGMYVNKFWYDNIVANILVKYISEFNDRDIKKILKSYHNYRGYSIPEIHISVIGRFYYTTKTKHNSSFRKFGFPYLSIDYVDEFIDDLDINEIVMNRLKYNILPIPIQIIEKYINMLHSDFYECHILADSFLDRNMNKTLFINLLCNRKFNEETLEKYINKYTEHINWELISSQQLSEQFMGKYVNYLDWEIISTVQKYSTKFMLHNYKRLYWKDIIKQKIDIFDHYGENWFTQKYNDIVYYNCIDLVNDKIYPKTYFYKSRVIE